VGPFRVPSVARPDEAVSSLLRRCRRLLRPGVSEVAVVDPDEGVTRVDPSRSRSRSIGRFSPVETDDLVDDDFDD
jgi:hypothetical protein